MSSGTAEDTSSHSMRIASHGKVSLLVAFAVKFLKENPTRPLVLHTLPHKSGTSEQAEVTEPSAKKQRIEPSTTNVSRLISVAEIIKREFKLAPLHQYNELGCLDSPEPRGGGPGVGVPDEPGEERQDALQKVLEGKNHLPIRRVPYMKITLSHTELPELVAQGATYQPAVVKKPSRVTKSRSRRRAKKATDSVEPKEGENADDDAMDIEPVPT